MHKTLLIFPLGFLLIHSVKVHCFKDELAVCLLGSLCLLHIAPLAAEKLGNVESMQQEELGNKSIKGSSIPTCADFSQIFKTDVFLKSRPLVSAKSFSFQGQKSIESQEPWWDLGVSASIWICFKCPSTASI